MPGVDAYPRMRTVEEVGEQNRMFNLFLASEDARLRRLIEERGNGTGLAALTSKFPRFLLKMTIFYLFVVSQT